MTPPVVAVCCVAIIMADNSEPAVITASEMDRIERTAGGLQMKFFDVDGASKGHRQKRTVTAGKGHSNTVPLLGE